LLELMDREQQVMRVAEVVDAAIAGGQSDQVIRTLGRAVVREGSDFHAYQTLEAGVQQFESLCPSQPLAARRPLVSVSCSLAAPAATPRTLHQTYQIAVRLLRGDDLSVAADEVDA